MSHKHIHRRFGPLFIVQHFILFTCVLLLILSGMPLKFPESTVARWAIALQGGMDARRIIHHTAGHVLIILGAFHFLYYVLFNWNPPFYKRAILPMPKDLLDMGQYMLYIIGKREDPPAMGRYTWYEKFDYIGLIWGIAVMGVTGMSMLYMDVALQYIPMSWLQALWAAHSEEAMLATLFLLIIHAYHVHFNPEKFPMSLTFLHGKISHEEMAKYHPLELAEWEGKAGDEPVGETGPLSTDPGPT